MIAIASLAIDNSTVPTSRAIVQVGDPYSYLSLDLGSTERNSRFKIDLVNITLRQDCLLCREQFHDVQVTIGDVKPIDPVSYTHLTLPTIYSV